VSAPQSESPAGGGAIGTTRDSEQQSESSTSGAESVGAEGFDAFLVKHMAVRGVNVEWTDIDPEGHAP